MTGLFPEPDDNALYLSRRDANEILGTCSAHQIMLDSEVWPTVEHYFQAMQFPAGSRRDAIHAAASPEQAHRLGNPPVPLRWFVSKIDDWPRLRRVYMTRGVYTKCREWDEVANALLATGDRKIVDNDQYDYYWGCGRDLRGENTYGQVLMDVRARLREEAGP